MEFNKLPTWLILASRVAMLGAIYPQIRAIALKYSPAEKRLLIRWYLDREPTGMDWESIAVFKTELYASSWAHIDHNDLECVYSTARLADLDCLDGWIYARREYFDEE